jgi:hypothetical protein
MSLLAAMALPAVLSACGDDESPCPDGEVLVGDECVSAEA